MKKVKKTSHFKRFAAYKLDRYADWCDDAPVQLATLVASAAFVAVSVAVSMDLSLKAKLARHISKKFKEKN
jgi:hypothetical protein